MYLKINNTVETFNAVLKCRLAEANGGYVKMVDTVRASDEEAAKPDLPTSGAVGDQNKEGQVEKEKAMDCDNVTEEASAKPQAVSDGISKGEEEVEMIDVLIAYKREKINLTVPVNWTVKELKDKLASVTGVPVDLQKLTTKCSMKDETASLKSLRVVSGTKFLLIGNKQEQINEVTKACPPNLLPVKPEASKPDTTPLCMRPAHKKILDKGVPSDAMCGIRNTKDALPPNSITGMLNKYGKKVRLTFKLEMDELWISTKERTDKVQLTRIRDMLAEPIKDHEEYFIVGLQLGTTEASRYWLYWVPAQFVDAIRKAIFGG